MVERSDARDSGRQRVTGIGGVFFKADDPAALLAWYREHLGVPIGDDGFAVFRWRESDPERAAATVFAPFPRDTDYFAPSQRPFMVNLRVVDLDRMLDQLRAEGCQVVGDVMAGEEGRFGWVLDPEGNKIELWEPPPERP